MGAGGKSEAGPMSDLRLENVAGVDPETEKRQMHLWDQAQQYAETSPFQAQYGGASAIPGMEKMSQRGQQYLTDAILGPGQYGAQNLGFAGYQRPGEADPSPGWDYSAMPPPSPPPSFGLNLGMDPNWTPGQGLNLGTEEGRLAAAMASLREQGYTFDPVTGQVTSSGQQQVASGGGGLTSLEDGLPISKSVQESVARSVQDQDDRPLPAGGGGGPSAPGLLDKRSIEEYYREVEGRNPYSQTVGIREMEEGAEATRRMLEEGAPVAPAYTDITRPSIDWTTVGEPTAIGAIGQAAAPETRFDVGGIEDYGGVPELAGVEDLAVERITGGGIAGPTDVTIDPVYGAETRGVDPVTAQQIGAPLGQVEILPTQAATALGVGGVAPGEFGGASFLGGPAIQDYMNQAGVGAQVAQAQEDYERQLNALQAQQAGTGTFGARAQLEDLGALEARQRNVAAIRGAGYERAAQMMEADIARQQQAGLQGQQLGAQTGLAGQALEAQRYESDAAREQQAALAAQQLTMQSGLQRQQLAQQALTRQAELGTQAGLQSQQLEAQRREADAARAQQAALAGQQLGTQTGMQTQQLQQQAAMQTAQNALTAAQSNQQAVMQSGTQQQQLEAARQTEEARLGLSAAQQTQQLGAQAGLQQQQLGTQVAMQNAQNEIRIAEQNMQAALQTGDQQSAINAQRQIAEAQMRLDAATRNQTASLQAAGMGLDAQAQFRQQQMGAAQQLADVGGMTQGATFGAGAQLAGMGAAQEQARRQQMAFDYEQWLRGIEGGAESLALTQSMMPGAQQWQYGRKPSLMGQIGGGLLGAGGLAVDAYTGRKGYR
jgi:hypothetical protein